MIDDLPDNPGPDPGLAGPLSAAPGPARAGDLLATAGEEKSDQIDGVAGEMSRFYESFGFYGHGVSVTTAVVPDGLARTARPALESGDWRCSWLVSGAP